MEENHELITDEWLEKNFPREEPYKRSWYLFGGTMIVIAKENGYDVCTHYFDGWTHQSEPLKTVTTKKELNAIYLALTDDDREYLEY